MTSSEAYREKLDSLGSQQNTLQMRLFWLIFLTIEGMTIASALMMTFENTSWVDIATRWLCVVAFFAFMLSAKRTKRYEQSYMAMCLLFNCVLLPVNYFASGGLSGAIPLHYLIGLFMCSFVMSSKQKVFSFLISLTVMLGSVVVGLLCPEYVRPTNSLTGSANLIFSLVVVSSALNMVTSLVMREHRSHIRREINNGIVDVLSTVVESRSAEAGDHVMRIKGYTRLLLEQVNDVYGINLTLDEKEIVYSASAMHDVGKIAIPDSVLLKPGRFTPEEFEIMKKHTIYGCDIISSMKDIQDKRYYEYCYNICRYHHERYDGKGYPEGLVGDEIPLMAQIVSLADVYDALINSRCYKKAISLDKAYEMIVNGECGAFSPKLLECFRRARSKMEEFAREPFVNPLEAKMNQHMQAKLENKENTD